MPPPAPLPLVCLDASLSRSSIFSKNHTFSVLVMLCVLLSVGVYINVLNSYLHSKEVSRNHKYMYTYTYIKYIYIKMKLSLSGILPQLLNFF